MINIKLYQDIIFNKEITDEDFISPGGYEIIVETEDKEEKSVKFDFETFIGDVNRTDPRILHCVQKNPDNTVFSDLTDLTEYQLRHIKLVEEWYVDIESPDENLALVRIENVVFEIITDNETIKIPITVDIK